jgi:hypothetical protein
LLRIDKFSLPTILSESSDPVEVIQDGSVRKMPSSPPINNHPLVTIH